MRLNKDGKITQKWPECHEKNHEEEGENPLVFVFFALFSERPKTNRPFITYYCKRKCRADSLAAFPTGSLRFSLTPLNRNI